MPRSLLPLVLLVAVVVMASGDKERRANERTSSGVAGSGYFEEEGIRLYVNQVESDAFPLSFNYEELLPCQNWDRFWVTMKVDQGCTPLCGATLDGFLPIAMRRLIHRGYRVNMTLDQVSVLSRSQNRSESVPLLVDPNDLPMAPITDDEGVWQVGCPLGFESPASLKSFMMGEIYLYNHLKFVVYYTENPDTGRNHVKRVEVHPVSIHHELPPDLTVSVDSRTPFATCNGTSISDDPKRHLPLRVGDSGSLSVVYSYEVQWKNSSQSRVDLGAQAWSFRPKEKRLVFDFPFTFFACVLVLTGLVSRFLMHAVHKDVEKYNKSEAPGDETGWCALHADVFRPPRTNPVLIAVLMGLGVQIGCITVIATFAISTRLLSPLRHMWSRYRVHEQPYLQNYERKDVENVGHIDPWCRSCARTCCPLRDRCPCVDSTARVVWCHVVYVSCDTYPWLSLLSSCLPRCVAGFPKWQNRASLRVK